MAVAAARTAREFGPPLPRRFYARPTVEVARDLLGAILVRVADEGTTAARIVETEAYFGLDDRASHGYAGLTPRTRVMFGPPGHAYVYFIYGNHDMLNVVTEREGEPAAVLVRAAEPIAGLDLMAARRGVPGPKGLTDGPGRLCRAMGITRAMNGVDLTAPGGPLYIAARPGRPPRIVTTTRVGITHDRERLQRYYVEGSPCVSRP
ncbi:MAG TPA: DNA-3-methyladenine glycosylase [Thermodesulfobacteriota bacterium]